MRVLAVVSTLAMVVAACDDGECLEGVCADPSETRALPGPCTIGSNGTITATTDRRFERCDIHYDAEHRPASATCTVYALLGQESLFEASWTYDPTSGELASYDSQVPWENDSTTRWSWEPTRVRVEFLQPNRPPALYSEIDRALFAFDPQPTSVHVFPTASLGVLSRLSGSDLLEYTWTRAGDRLIQTPTAGGPPTTYDLDARGRLIAINDGYVTYDYEGEHLVRRAVGGQVVTYAYDAGGNISEALGPGTRRQVFGYNCW